MRSITFRMILAFLTIGLISIVIIVLLARWNTTKEFRKFVFDQNQTDFIAALSDYYSTNGSWEGVGDLFPPPSNQPQTGHEPNPMPPFSLTDEAGKVVLSRDRHTVGDQIPQSELDLGIPIEVAGRKVGILIISPAPFEGSPRAQEFIQRNNSMLLYSALGASAVVLLLGVFLSRTLTRPIRELTLATHAVSEGDLSQQVPVRSRDELGELAKAFNKMSVELTRSINARRQMTADIAHELRTPLSLILGHAEAVHDGVLPPSAETFEIIREEASRLEHLVDDLRTLSMADAGELRLALEAVPPEKLLERVAASFSHRANQKSIALEIKTASNLPEIEADFQRMIEVLSNIMDNALRYTPENGQIILSADHAQDTLEIRIQDSGPGVATDELERIFDRFYRTEPSRGRDEGGSGLGFAIAKSIVEKHNGRIWAESKPGEGLTVVIRLPTSAGPQ